MEKYPISGNAEESVANS